MMVVAMAAKRVAATTAMAAEAVGQCQVARVGRTVAIATKAVQCRASRWEARILVPRKH